MCYKSFHTFYDENDVSVNTRNTSQMSFVLGGKRHSTVRKLHQTEKKKDFVGLRFACMSRTFLRLVAAPSTFLKYITCSRFSEFNFFFHTKKTI